MNSLDIVMTLSLMAASFTLGWILKPIILEYRIPVRLVDEDTGEHVAMHASITKPRWKRSQRPGDILTERGSIR